jgi:hypothetical protein
MTRRGELGGEQGHFDGDRYGVMPLQTAGGSPLPCAKKSLVCINFHLTATKRVYKIISASKNWNCIPFVVFLGGGIITGELKTQMNYLTNIPGLYFCVFKIPPPPKIYTGRAFAAARYFNIRFSNWLIFHIFSQKSCWVSVLCGYTGFFVLSVDNGP